MFYKKILQWGGASSTLPSVLITFLFIGFIKQYVWSPIDLTILVSMVVYLIIILNANDLPSVINPSLVLLLLLVCWCLVSVALCRHPPAWGERKIIEIVAFGVPAYLAGFLVSRHRHMQDATMKILATSGALISAVVVVQAAATDPYTFSSFGSGGYQLTGVFLAMAFISSAILRRHTLFAVNILGCAVTGNISGAVFGGVIVLGLWLRRQEWRNALVAAARAFLATTAYCLFVAPPLIFMRILWKFGGVILVLLNAPVTGSAAINMLMKYGVGRALVAALQRMTVKPEEINLDYSSADRIDLYVASWNVFVHNFLTGAGFGNVKYLDLTYPHNILVEIAAETGLTGLLLIAALIAISVFNLAKSNNAFLTSFFAIIFMTYMVSGYFGSRMLFCALGLAAGAYGVGAEPSRLTSKREILKQLAWIFEDSIPDKLVSASFWKQATAFTLIAAVVWLGLDMVRAHFNEDQQTTYVWEVRSIVAGNDQASSAAHLATFAREFGYLQIAARSGNQPIVPGTFTYSEAEIPPYGIIIAWMRNDEELDRFFSNLERTDGILLYPGSRRVNKLSDPYPWSRTASALMGLIFSAIVLFAPTAARALRHRMRLASVKVQNQLRRPPNSLS